MSDMKRLLSGAYILGYSDARNDKAIDVIGAIERLTMNMNKSDLISRQDVLSLAKDVILINGAKHRCIDATQIHELPSAESEAYNLGWKEGREALRKEIWEDGRDRLD